MTKSILGERITQLRGELSQKAFADKLNVSRNTLSRYENGDRTPDAEFLQKLIEEFRVDANWLLLGAGEPPQEEDRREAMLLSHFRHCDETGKDAMLTTGAALAQPQSKKD